MSVPATRPVDPDSPPHKGPRVKQRAILARTRCATALRLRRAKSDSAQLMARLLL